MSKGSRQNVKSPRSGKGCELPSLDEIAEMVRPALQEADVLEAFLCGPYVREFRNGDLRNTDRLHVLVVADAKGHHRSRVKQIVPFLDPVFEDVDISPSVAVATPEIVSRYDGSEGFAEAHYDADWLKIYGAE